ncbi:MAG: zinc ribbon domain-containing protein [Butyrivibrio sp.]|nr:zinc ribbon domain-containing protein [Butyrivibrio sp.]
MLFCVKCGTDIKDGILCQECTPEAGICIYCGEKLRPGVEFCTACGKKQDKLTIKPEYCSNCGSKLGEEDQFCPECGNKISEIVYRTGFAKTDRMISEAKERAVSIKDRMTESADNMITKAENGFFSSVEFVDSKMKNISDYAARAKDSLFSGHQTEAVRPGAAADKPKTRIRLILLLLVLGLLLAFCAIVVTNGSVYNENNSSLMGDVRDQVMNAVQTIDPDVQSVKNASPSEYPNKTYGEAFDSYFASPTWKSFESSSGTIVEFTGYCTYDGQRVKARIQFTLDKDAGMFTVNYLSFNDVTQSLFVYWALFGKIFE